VDPRVAVRASPVEIPYRIEQSRDCRMPARDVTGIAHARHPNLEQLRIIGSVRLVAVCAVFHDRRMLPQKRTATLCMAAQAILSCGRLNELLRVGSTVRVVATGASHLAFAIGHM